MYTDMVIDVETLAVSKRPVLRSVGAVVFTLPEGELGPIFYELVDRTSCMEFGLEIDPDTLEWWERQSDKAKQEFKGTGKPVKEVLYLLRNYIKHYTRAKDVRVWGNGAGFDNAILEECYRLAGIELPWKYWNNVDYRTLKIIDKEILKVGSDDSKEHIADKDAVIEAEHIIRWWKELVWLRSP